MNYLCAFLLLAFAASSVHCTICSSPKLYKDGKVNSQEPTPICKCTEIQKLLMQYWSHFPQDFGTVSVPSLLTPITKVDGLKMDLINITVTFENFELVINVDVYMNCDLFKNVATRISIRVSLDVSLEDGCSLLRLLSSPIIELSVTDSLTVGLDPALFEGIFKVITIPVTKAVEHVLNLAMVAINCLSKAFTRPLFVGSEKCHYELSQMIANNGLLQGVICFKTAERSECSENVVVTLENNVLSVAALTNNVLENILSSVIKDFDHTVQISAAILGSLVDTYGDDIFVSITLESLDNCAFQPHGADISLILKINVFAGADPKTMLVSATTKLELTAEIIHSDNYFGFKLAASISPDLVLALVEDDCGCQESVFSWLKILVKYELVPIIAALNAKVGVLLPVPQPSGIYSGTTAIIPQVGSCLFSFS